MNTFSPHQYAEFLAEYAALLALVQQDQRHMLDAVTSGSLQRMRQGMNTAQANTMRVEQMETRRAALQAPGGFGGLGIRQVIEQLPPEEQPPLLALCDKIDAAAREIHFLNTKSMSMAQCNLAELDPRLLEATLPQTAEGALENPYEKQRKSDAERPVIETKA